jgi:hypothetical protein
MLFELDSQASRFHLDTWSQVALIMSMLLKQLEDPAAVGAPQSP